MPHSHTGTSREALWDSVEQPSMARCTHTAGHGWTCRSVIPVLTLFIMAAGIEQLVRFLLPTALSGTLMSA